MELRKAARPQRLRRAGQAPALGSSDLIVASGGDVTIRRNGRYYTIGPAGAGSAAWAPLSVGDQEPPCCSPPAALLDRQSAGTHRLPSSTGAGKRAKALGFQLPQALEIIVRLAGGRPTPVPNRHFPWFGPRKLSDPVGFGVRHGPADEILFMGATMEAGDRADWPSAASTRTIDLFAAHRCRPAGPATGGQTLTGLLKGSNAQHRGAEAAQDAPEDQGRIVGGPPPFGDDPHLGRPSSPWASILVSFAALLRPYVIHEPVRQVRALGILGRVDVFIGKHGHAAA